MSADKASDPPCAELQAQILELRQELSATRAELLERESTWIEAFDADHERLARLLHDTLSQSLTAARMYARTVLGPVGRASRPGRANEAPLDVTALDDLLQTVARECQDLTRWVGPARLAGSNLIACMADLAELTSRTRPCEFFCSETSIDAEPSVQVQLLRIVQLALHALVRPLGDKTAPLALHLACDGRQLIAEIRTTASELPREIAKLLESRARSVSGTFRVERLRQGGHSVVCRLPQWSYPSSAAAEPSRHG